MTNARTDFFILSGGPGAGKTAVIEALAQRGEHTTVEAGRAVIAREAAAGNPHPWSNPARFAEQMLAWDIAEYENAAARQGRVFFDRGAPDVLGYLALVGIPAPPRIHAMIAALRYNPLVFIFPPWRSIYAQDHERLQNFAEAEHTHARMVRVYRDLGYQLVVVPPGTVEARVEFVLAQSATAPAD